ncbi:MAG TPA: rhodanese-like domain-containing protein [Azonexus sp.]
MKVPRLVLGLLVAVATLAARADVIDIDNAQLAKLMQDGVPVIDIRLQSEWEETGIVAGSKLHTFFDERGRADPAAWLNQVKPHARPDQPVVVICRSGNRTKAVSQFLSQQAGYATVYNVKAGIKGWLGERRPVVPAAPAIAACRAERTC